MNDHEFKSGDECPFCDGELEMVDGELKCNHEMCYFNKATWEPK